MGTSHRQRPVKALVGRIRAGLGELFALPDGYEVALGNGGTTAFWDAAAFGLVRERALHLAYGEFSQKFATVTTRRAVPGRADRSSRADPARRPTRPASATRAAEAGADVIAWAHNETSTGVMVPVLRPAGARRRAGRDRRDLGRRRPARRVSQTPTSTTSRRRRASPPTAACGWRCSAPPPRSGSPRCTRRSAGSRSSSRCSTALENSLQGPDLQHAGRRDAVPAGRAGRLDARAGRAGLVRRRARAPPPSTSTGGPSAARSRRRSSPSRRTARWSSARSTSTRPSTPRRVAATLRANGIVDVEPYRKLGRNQLRIGMFPAIEPADVQALTACIDWVAREARA